MCPPSRFTRHLSQILLARQIVVIHSHQIIIIFNVFCSGSHTRASRHRDIRASKSIAHSNRRGWALPPGFSLTTVPQATAMKAGCRPHHKRHVSHQHQFLGDSPLPASTKPPVSANVSLSRPASSLAASAKRAPGLDPLFSRSPGAVSAKVDGWASTTSSPPRPGRTTA